jgi:plastocyanin
MPNGVRNSIWAVFFLAGMAFMAALIFMVRPELFSNSAVREKPGTSVVLADSIASEPEAVPAQPLPTPALPMPNTEAKPVALKNERLSPSLETPVVDQTAQDAPELPVVSSVAAAPPQSPVPLASEIAHKVRPGRSVLGHVKLIGDLPPPKSFPLADKFCGSHSVATTIVSRTYLRAADNSLADVLVLLSGEKLTKRRWPAPPTNPVILNRNCQFEPYITPIQLGQGVTFENRDSILHNVHLRPAIAENGELNVAMMPRSRPVVAKFKAAEPFIRVECNVHPYMVAYICVVSHPFFALTKADGHFQIPNIPPGEYTLMAAHRKAGVREKKVIVTDDQSPEVEFVFESASDVAQNDSDQAMVLRTNSSER